MPLTPPAPRPIGRTSVSRKRMAWPSWLARKIIFFPSVSFAPINSSLPSRGMAMIPVERGLRNFHEPRDCFPVGGGGSFREFVNFEAVDSALGSEQQDVAVRGSDEEVLDEILFLGARADTAFAAP